MFILYENLDKIVAIIIMLCGSIYLRILLQLVGQNWIKTIAHTATFTLLAILTYVITTTLSKYAGVQSGVL